MAEFAFKAFGVIAFMFGWMAGFALLISTVSHEEILDVFFRIGIIFGIGFAVLCAVSYGIWAAGGFRKERS